MNGAVGFNCKAFLLLILFSVYISSRDASHMVLLLNSLGFET